MTTRVIAGCLLAITLLFGILLTPSQRIVVRSGDESIEICRRIPDGERVGLTFTNSMFGGDVRETYVAAGDSLTRVGFWTEVAAAAEYYAWTRPIDIADGGYEVAVPDESFASVPVLIDEVGNYRLVVADEEFGLSGMVDSPVSIVLEVESSTLISSWITDC
jgi:hypothetical protein